MLFSWMLCTEKKQDGKAGKDISDSVMLGRKKEIETQESTIFVTRPPLQIRTI